MLAQSERLAARLAQRGYTVLYDADSLAGPAIARAAVIAWQASTTETRLVAYLECRGEAEPAAGELEDLAWRPVEKMWSMEIVDVKETSDNSGARRSRRERAGAEGADAVERHGARDDLAIDAELSDPPGDELGGLASEVEDQHAVRPRASRSPHARSRPKVPRSPAGAVGQDLQSGLDGHRHQIAPDSEHLALRRVSP
ncbi:MAG: hypothetical protein HC794_05330 [Nitrospiraceae bacterium]|nr:hypothetical protein [Nitrospiraceae bacterium]